jgi:hypothetical protein
MLNFAEVTKYKVKDGDTLDSLAQANGMRWEELAHFNFGTSDKTEINKFLRSQVGCFKKTANRKNYIFTSKDDPGIIYIPKNLQKRVFSPNAKHEIVVERFEPKKFVPSKVMVHFRPKPDWKGEYGFDWLRLDGDVIHTEAGYENIINGGFNGDATTTGFSKEDAFTKLKTEYKALKTAIAEEPDYFPPYLNLFPKGVEGLEAAPFEAELNIGITVKDEEPLSVELEYDRNLFEIDKNVLTDIAVGAKRASGDGTLKITCLHEFDTNQEINILAYPKTWQEGDPVPLAGKIIVCPNNEVKEIRFVLIKVKTKLKNREKVGSFENEEMTNLKNALFQALVVGHLDNFEADRNIIERVIDFVFSLDPHCLDLSGDDNFKIGATSRGKFIDATTPKLNQNYRDAGVKNAELFFYLKDAFFKLDGSEKYKDHFPVFAFAESTNNDVIGQIQSIDGVFQKNLLLFGGRDASTLNHEVLHGLGLRHTHKEKPIATFIPKENAKYTFDRNTTDNVMSYVGNALTTWRWQWEILRNSI